MLTTRVRLALMLALAHRSQNWEYVSHTNRYLEIRPVSPEHRAEVVRAADEVMEQLGWVIGVA